MVENKGRVDFESYVVNRYSYMMMKWESQMNIKWTLSKTKKKLVVPTTPMVEEPLKIYHTAEA